MKANAPDKIYLNPLLMEDGESIVRRCTFERQRDSQIEYTRTDAFIEKACEWLRTHSEGDYFELIPDANYCGAGTLNKKRMVEDFEEYLKK